MFTGKSFYIVKFVYYFFYFSHFKPYYFILHIVIILFKLNIRLIEKIFEIFLISHYLCFKIQKSCQFFKLNIRLIWEILWELITLTF